MTSQWGDHGQLQPLGPGMVMSFGGRIHPARVAWISRGQGQIRECPALIEAAYDQSKGWSELRMSVGPLPMAGQSSRPLIGL
ncbi:MAG: hypothetical protein CFE28_01410 [Alphaproteobacteria bacterium PA2]|nr:MAG: hypothetical protein CFE28_01410 [Alphaproteobacteria bacterium PA2]